MNVGKWRLSLAKRTVFVQASPVDECSGVHLLAFFAGTKFQRSFDYVATKCTWHGVHLWTNMVQIEKMILKRVIPIGIKLL